VPPAGGRGRLGTYPPSALPYRREHRTRWDLGGQTLQGPILAARRSVCLDQLEKRPAICRPGSFGKTHHLPQIRGPRTPFDQPSATQRREHEQWHGDPDRGDRHHDERVWGDRFEGVEEGTTRRAATNARIDPVTNAKRSTAHTSSAIVARARPRRGARKSVALLWIDVSTRQRPRSRRETTPLGPCRADKERGEANTLHGCRAARPDPLRPGKARGVRTVHRTQ
jgi:hypothetical protein